MQVVVFWCALSEQRGGAEKIEFCVKTGFIDHKGVVGGERGKL